MRALVRGSMGVLKRFREVLPCRPLPHGRGSVKMRMPSPAQRAPREQAVGSECTGYSSAAPKWGRLAACAAVVYRRRLLQARQSGRLPIGRSLPSCPKTEPITWRIRMINAAAEQSLEYSTLSAFFFFLGVAFYLLFSTSFFLGGRG